MSHANETLLRDFYRAFGQKDWKSMEPAYHADVHFTDPVFDLHGPRVIGMWRMLCTSSTDLSLVNPFVEADDRTGRARWEATYTFTLTGRKVLNRIDATFEFRDGKIVRHIDDFNFWKWSSQALGPTGILLGWTPLVRAKVQRNANARLEKFLAKQ